MCINKELLKGQKTTLSALEQEYNIFYSKLQIVISNILYHIDVLSVCNGRHRTRKMNASSKFYLIITNTISQQEGKYRNS